MYNFHQLLQSKLENATYATIANCMLTVHCSLLVLPSNRKSILKCNVSIFFILCYHRTQEVLRSFSKWQLYVMRIKISSAGYLCSYIVRAQKIFHNRLRLSLSLVISLPPAVRICSLLFALTAASGAKTAAMNKEPS